MSNDRTKYQLLLERLSSDSTLKDQALNATPEEFLTLCRNNGLKIEADNAKTLQERIKETFSEGESGELSIEQLEKIAGGVDCVWGCGPLQCC